MFSINIKINTKSQIRSPSHNKLFIQPLSYAKALSTPPSSKLAACPKIGKTTNSTKTRNITIPLSANSTANLNSFLQLLLSVPETIFEEGDASISSFFSSIGSCVSNNAAGLEISLNALVSSIPSFVANIGSETSSAAKRAENEVEGLLGDIGIHLREKSQRATASISLHKRGNSFTDLFGNITNIAACMSATLNNNTLFDVGRCALDLVEPTQPETRLGEIKKLIGVAGGVVKTLQDLEAGNATSTTIGPWKTDVEVLWIFGR